MDERLGNGSITQLCSPAGAGFEGRLDRLEGLLHHLMCELRDALTLLEGVRDSAESSSLQKLAKRP